MARMIDADALIKEITEVRCVNCDRRKGMKKGKMTFVYEIGEVSCRACDVMDMIDVLDEAPTVCGWVSVKDRLPEVNKSILYCAFGHSVGEGTYRGFDGIHHVWNMYAVSGTHWDDDVTHWMPMPEPPEEVSGDE